jgi:hypothetical protein
MVAKKTKKLEECCSDSDCCSSEPCCTEQTERPPMSGMCYSIGGLLAFLAGFVFLLGAYGQLDTTTVYIAAGLLLVFHGLGGVLHVVRACPMCKSK